MNQQKIALRDRVANAVVRHLKTVRSGRLGRERFVLTTWAYRLLPLLGYDYCRLVEWKFVLNNLPRDHLRVLDVGTNLSLFVYELAGRGYDTSAVDFSPFAERLPPAIKFIQADTMHLPFADEHFDAVTMISVIEHVGLGAYETSVFPDGDLRAMSESWRILKPGGHLYLTTVIGNRFIVTPDFGMARIYDEDHLAQLVAAFRGEREEYYRFVPNQWRLVSKAEAFNEPPERFGLACLMLRKGALCPIKIKR